ncbi:hypothetical protein Sinac_4079 [Singulisphaera acidiphila DSM 18658]|uniref:Uncharacterized protein n=1 Tax=Singulisphaera acidiphila (strain ATCC BAA-1392 / DSM 18658 / VKM B-2454 / MOB10) TaxID=886293 RepID=L0DFZ5_SINAD|nr:hypothetical protein Sinac_4079 [Singulisphaera acidiphila DSM 18658]
MNYGPEEHPPLHRRGDIVELDGLLGVIVAVPGEIVETTLGTDRVPETHVALWFGDSGGKRISEGGIGGQVPEIWTVPIELCLRASKPLCRH